MGQGKSTEADVNREAFNVERATMPPATLLPRGIQGRMPPPHVMPTDPHFLNAPMANTARQPRAPPLPRHLVGLPAPLQNGGSAPAMPMVRVSNVAAKPGGVGSQKYLATPQSTRDTVQAIAATSWSSSRPSSMGLPRSSSRRDVPVDLDGTAGLSLTRPVAPPARLQPIAPSSSLTTPISSYHVPHRQATGPDSRLHTVPSRDETYAWPLAPSLAMPSAAQSSRGAPQHETHPFAPESGMGPSYGGGSVCTSGSPVRGGSYYSTPSASTLARRRSSVTINMDASVVLYSEGEGGMHHTTAGLRCASAAPLQNAPGAAAKGILKKVSSFRAKPKPVTRLSVCSTRRPSEQERVSETESRQRRRRRSSEERQDVLTVNAAVPFAAAAASGPVASDSPPAAEKGIAALKPLQLTAAPELHKLWQASPTLVLYETPLRLQRRGDGRSTTRGVTAGVETTPQDDDGYPVETYGEDCTLVKVRVAPGKSPLSFKVDELVAHRKASVAIDSTLLLRARHFFLAGYPTSVLGLDQASLIRDGGSPLESPSCLAMQKLVTDVLAELARLRGQRASPVQHDYAVGSTGEVGDVVRLAFSLALVRRAPAEETTAMESVYTALDEGAFVCVDLLSATTPLAAQPLQLRHSALYGTRVGNVTYHPITDEAEFNTLFVAAQARALDYASHELVDEGQGGAGRGGTHFYVLTCMLARSYGSLGQLTLDHVSRTPAPSTATTDARELKDGDSLLSIPAAVRQRLSDDLSTAPDLVVSCLTCVMAENRLEVYDAALEHDPVRVPVSLLDGVLGGVCESHVVLGLDPRDASAAGALEMQSRLGTKLHRYGPHGSARHFLAEASLMVETHTPRTHAAGGGADGMSWKEKQLMKLKEVREVERLIRGVQEHGMSELTK